jgi:hypothetical protein
LHVRARLGPLSDGKPNTITYQIRAPSIWASSSERDAVSMRKMHFGKRECHAAFRISLLRWMELRSFVTLTLRDSTTMVPVVPRQPQVLNSHSETSIAQHQPSRTISLPGKGSRISELYAASTYHVLGAWDVPEFQRAFDHSCANPRRIWMIVESRVCSVVRLLTEYQPFFKLCFSPCTSRLESLP